MTIRRQVIFWAVGAAAFVVLLLLLRSILLPFIAGLGAAYFLDPAVDRVEKIGAPRWLATSAITVVFFAIVVGGGVLLFPVVQGQVLQLAGNLPEYVARVQESVLPLVERGLALISRGEAEGPGGASSLITSNAGKIVGDVLKGVLSSGLALFNLLSLIFITPVVTFYLLRDWDRIIAKVDSWLPRQHRTTIHEQLHKIDEALAGFLRGQTMVGLILAVLFSIALSLAGLQFALVIGIFSGLITFVPFAGFILGFAVALLFAFLQWGADLLNVGIIVGIYVALQVIETAVLTPKFVGSRVGLHPVWIIFSVLAAGALFGFVGVLVAVPLAAVIGILIRFSIGQYLGSPLYLGAGGTQSGPTPSGQAPSGQVPPGQAPGPDGGGGREAGG